MSVIKMGSKTLFTQTGNNNAVMSPDVVLPSGSIIQVQYTQFDGVATMSSLSANTDYILCDGVAGSGTEILNVTITPRYNTSKIWVQVAWMGEFSPVSMTWESIFFLYRNTTKLHNTTGATSSGIMTPSTAYGNTDGDSTPENCMFQYFDSPGTTNDLTYKVGIKSAAGTVYTNRTVVNNLSDGYERGVSSIVAIEIKG